MANKDAAFGFRPIGKVGQNRDNQGLSEYNIAANSSAIYQNDTVQFLATGTCWSSRHYNCSSIRIT
jgi:hypothetical protein